MSIPTDDTADDSSWLSEVTEEDLATVTGFLDTQSHPNDGPGNSDTAAHGETVEIDDVEHAGVAPDEADPESSGTPKAPLVEFQFSDPGEFMVKFIGAMIERPISTSSGQGLRWDPDWWKYPEAVFRAELMWKTFEIARADPNPGAMESWARTVMDYHMSILLNGAHGPMRNVDGPGGRLGATMPPWEWPEL